MAPGYSMRSLRDMGNPYQPAPEVSIVRTDTCRHLYALFAQQPIHSQPTRSLARGLEVFRIAAPRIALQGHLGREQFGAHRVEMNVIAPCAEVAIAAALNHQRFVAPREEMPAQLVPDIEALGVNAQEPLHPKH